MKTKTFLFLCLILGISTFQLSAQNGKNGTNGVVSFWETSDFGSDVIAEDGTVLDVLNGTLETHAQIHFNDGVIFRIDYVSHGIVTSDKTGEIFKMIEIGKQPVSSWDPETGDPVGFDFFRVHLIGDHGTHLMIEATLDFSTWETTITKILWPGDKYWEGN
jgi:hypothetical protein